MADHPDNSGTDISLAELLIVAASEAWRDNGEVLASGIGIIPRLGASLAKLTHSPELLMTDSEAYLVAEPVPVGPRGDYRPRYEGHLPFERVFECVWGGRRHAMIGPTQIDRWAQTNLSAVGGSYAQPKAAILGMRGLPGNSIHHRNSFFVPRHGPRVFVAEEVDVVCGAGFQPRRRTPGAPFEALAIGRVVTDLCVMDFNGPDHAAQVISLHPGIDFASVQAATGFPLRAAESLAETPLPTAEQLAIIARLDPHGLRHRQLPGNPPAQRSPAQLAEAGHG